MLTAALLLRESCLCLEQPLAGFELLICDKNVFSTKSRTPLIKVKADSINLRGNPVAFLYKENSSVISADRKQRQRKRGGGNQRQGYSDGIIVCGNSILLETNTGDCRRCGRLKFYCREVIHLLNAWPMAYGLAFLVDS